ncbi:TonB-dependent receptor [Rhodocytophaga aerolata]|uniref:TonB-dependent receptor n=1 Tax=Rhodocytophaga aerolata TaxID=455078 RepID=A0ABT8R4L5_9BACT|nr:TonB-dependent receptor [Rhodocytophaga aerolata]MDO1447015.1 TonB-dependent receptor [Rhodocytophaga aerolata]
MVSSISTPTILRVFLLYFLFSLPAFAQNSNGIIQGRITSGEGQPAAYVSVIVKGTNLGTSTNDTGNFVLRNVPVGTQTLVISSIGFQPQEQRVEVMAGQTTDISVIVDEGVQNLKEVEVLGQKRRTSTITKNDIELINIPMSVQVIGQDILQQQQVIDMKDVVKNVSGINQTGSYNGGYQYFNSRGFDMNNWTNFRRNGTLLWNMGNHFADFYENIEFLKGPAAILYGDVAPGGIINFVTKKPLTYDYRRLELKVGQYGLFRPTFDISGPLNEKRTVLYRLNATYEKSRSFRNVVENETFMLAPSLTWMITPRTQWTVEGTYKNDNRVGDPGIVSPDNTFAGLSKISEKTFLGEREATYTYINSSAYSTLKHQLTDSWSLQNVTSYNTTERTPLNVYINNDADQAGNITRYQYFFKQRFDTWTTAFDLIGEVKTGFARHKLLIGGDYVNDRIRMGGFLQENIEGSLNLFNPQLGAAPLMYLPQVWENSAGYTNRLGFYLQDQISMFDEKLQLLLGIRYNQYVSGTAYNNKADEPADADQVIERPLIPRFGLVYKPQPWLSVYGSYAQSYEVNGFDWIDASKQVPPTYGKQLEFGVKGDFFDRKLGLTLAAFNIAKEDVYNWAYANSAPDFEYVSFLPGEGSYFTYLANKHQSRGLELDINGKLTDNLRILASGSVIVAQIVDDVAYQKGNWLMNQPRQMFNVWGNYQFTSLLKGLDLGYGIYYKGYFYGDNENTPENKVPANYTMDAAIGYSYRQARIQLNVTNLTNRINYLGGYGVWEPQWTRRALLSVSYKF